MLADTANLIIRLGLKDETKGQLKNTQTGLSGLQKAAIGVATLGFGAMTKGALQAEEAQGKFMAATGKSREEAKKFVSGMDSLAGSAGAVGVSFEDIAETGTMVEQQFGTTGQATTDLTDDILKFAKVTGQDAEGAAADLEDTLSSYGLTANDAAGFMDKLVASNQKFGTEAGPETLSILNGMAPALTAMGMGLDDGVELLNAFEVAGLDAGSAQRGLQTAIKELEPGQNLDDLIAQIGAIEDPTKRAQKAIEIFGSKAGAGLAQVIKPGMTSLDDFGVSAEESSGKLDTAAENMLTTSDKIRGMLEKLGAGFREVGQEFGPLVTGIATAAPAVSTGVKKIWDAMGGAESSVAIAAKNAGITSGRIFAAGALIGVSAILVFGIAQAFEDAKTQLETDPQGINSVDLFNARAPMWAKAKVSAQQQMQGISQEALVAFNLEWNRGIAAGLSPQAALEPARQAGLAVGAASGQGAMEGFTDHLRLNDMSKLVPHFRQVGTSMVDFTSQGVVARQGQLADDARETVMFANLAMMREAENADRVGDALADGLLDGIPNIRDAWKQFLQETKNALDPMKQITWLEGRLAGDKLADALASKNPLTRRRAELMRDEMMAQLDDLKTLMGIEGTKGSNSLANNMDAGPAVNKARGIMQKLANIFNQQFTVGVGVKAGTGKGKKAPGEHVGGGGRAHGGPVAGNSIYEVNELGAPEMLTAGGRNYLLMGRHGGQVTPFMPGGGVSRGGGPMTVNVNLFLNGYQLTRAQEHIRRVQGGQVVG